MIFKPNKDIYVEVFGSYSIPIILLSIVLAGLALYTAIILNNRMHQNSFFHRRVWTALASIAMGFGIWSMHFIGMNALLMPFKIDYSYFLTFASILPAIAASYLAFSLAGQSDITKRKQFTAAIIMGLGMAVMHHLGMLSMQMNAVFQYDLTIVAIATIIAILISYAAVLMFHYLRRRVNNWHNNIITALFMGLAVSSIHYIGTFGTNYYIHEDQLNQLIPQNHSNMVLLNSTVTIGLIILFIILLITSLIDRYVDYWMVNFDPLTKLPNRRNWDKLLTDPEEFGDVAIWHFPDINKINGEHGYLIGDKVISYLGNFFSRLSPTYAGVYRISGNRYLLHTTHLGKTADFHKTLLTMSEKLSNGIWIEDQFIAVRTVCALAEADETKNLSQLYKDSQIVLEHPSTERNGEIVTFNIERHGNTYENQLLQDLDVAMNEDELFLVFQPKVASTSNEILGVETLLRWQHPVHGFLPPNLFIPILEKNGRMEDVTDWIIDKVFKQIMEWDRKQFHIAQVAINIPGEYVTERRLLEVLTHHTKKYDVSPNRIELEVTETSIATSIERAVSCIEKFKALGYSVALDDFGTGVSSLSYLRRLPITTMKIDKSFIDDIPRSTKDSNILKAILSIGKSLDLQIVIEGVEKKDQVDFLTNEHSSLIFQGYYFAKPMEVDHLQDWVENQSRLVKK